MNIRKAWMAVGCLLVVLWMLGSCSTRVLMPPRVQLGQYKPVGMVLVSASDRSLSEAATQEVMKSIHDAQPGIPILELGTRGRLLSEIDAEEWNAETVRKLGTKHKAGSIFLGHLEVSRIKPRIEMSSEEGTLDAQAALEGTLRAKLYDTEHGATIWTGSVRSRVPVARLHLGTEGNPEFGASDAENARDKLLRRLAHGICRDFRSYYARTQRSTPITSERGMMVLQDGV